jgi:magnesium chelatase family protein
MEAPAQLFQLCQRYSLHACPCGFFGDPRKACSCSPLQINRYQSRISGPLLDRFDLQIEVPRMHDFELDNYSKGESSVVVRGRVDAARKIQRERFAGNPYFCNAHMSSKDLRKYCRIDTEGRELLREASQRFSFSARAYTRILKLARTIADLEAADPIELHHLAEAIQYRSLDRK